MGARECIRPRIAVGSELIQYLSAVHRLTPLNPSRTGFGEPRLLLLESRERAQPASRYEFEHDVERVVDAALLGWADGRSVSTVR